MRHPSQLFHGNLSIFGKRSISVISTISYIIINVTNVWLEDKVQLIQILYVTNSHQCSKNLF